MTIGMREKDLFDKQMCESSKTHQKQLASETICDVMRRALQTSMAPIENNVGLKHKKSQEHKEAEEAEKIAAEQDIWVMDQMN